MTERSGNECGFTIEALLKGKVMIDTNYNADPTCFLPPNPEAVYQADCALRRTEDEVHRMKLAILMSCQKNGTLAGFLERQTAIVEGRKPRERAKAGREVLA